MKITQHMIDQAAIIANAKVGDELEESCQGGPFEEVIKEGLCISSANYTYRIKPQPRTVWVNEYEGSTVVHSSEESARAMAYPNALRIAVEYREVVK